VPRAHPHLHAPPEITRTGPSTVAKLAPAVGLALAIGAFIVTVVAANLLTNRYGLIGVGFGLTATAGTAAAGLTLLARDGVHHTGGRTYVLACIAVGALGSAVLTSPRLALASATAFGCSEAADWAVYQRLYRRGWIVAALASNTVGAPVDTVLFLTLAGFGVWPALAGQLWVKAIATIIPLTLVTTVRAVLRHRLRPPGP